MQHTRIAIIGVLLVGGLFGVYWIATGQEGRPWPPPPVKFDPGSSDRPVVPPPVPPSGSMPSAPSDPRNKQAGNPNSVSGKWTVNVLPAEAPKGRACGIGQDGGLQPVSFQETGAPLPPPIPPMVSVPASELKPPAPPPLPKLPLDNGPFPLLGPGLVPVKPAELERPLAMPSADPPRADPSKSVITDPVQQALPGKSRPPAFVPFKNRKMDGAASSLPSIQDPAGGPPVQHTVSRAISTGNGGPALLGLQTPPVSVEKRAMAPARPGEPQPFQLIVRNLGSIAAAQISVEDDLPPGSRVLHADPVPVAQAGRVTWTLGELAPGAVRVLSLTVQTAGPIEVHSTRVQVAAAGSVAANTAQATLAGPPAAALAVQVGAPSSIPAGQAAVFEVTYVNIGKQRLTGLVLHVLLSDGLRHPVGQSIEADVGDLEPGATKTIKVNATALQPGRQGVQVQLKSALGVEASAQAGIDVSAAAPPPPAASAASAASAPLTIQQTPARLFVGRTGDLRIEVTNNTSQPLRNVCIASYLPEGVEFVAASDYGNYQPNGRTVNWRLDPLPPGKTQAVLVRVQPTGQGALTHNLVVRADGVPEHRASAALAVEGLADLAIVVNGGNAVEVGKETVYEVRIANPGSGPNTNVRVQVDFTTGLVPRNAKGPASFRIDGQSVIFEGLAMLVNQGQTVFQVLAQGQAPGEARVRASVVSDQVRAPATREVGTRVYRD